MTNNLNQRQGQILKDFNINKFSYITITSYKNIFNISKPTAIEDLKKLKNKHILNIKKVGKEIRYYKTN